MQQGQGGQDQENLDALLGKGDHAGTRKRAMHMKRYDPRNPLSSALLVQKKEADQTTQNDKKTAQSSVTSEQARRKAMLEEGRLQVLNKRKELNAMTLSQRKEKLQE